MTRHASSLPEGWYSIFKQGPKKTWYEFHGPAGERARSVVQAHRVASGEEVAKKPKSRERKSRFGLSASAIRKTSEQGSQWASMAYRGQKVPRSIGVPADADLPGWRIERAQLADGKTAILVYLHPSFDGRVYSRAHALRLTGQLPMNVSERWRVHQEEQRRSSHCTALKQLIGMFAMAKRLQDECCALYAARAATEADGGMPHLGNYPRGEYLRDLTSIFKRTDKSPARLAVIDLFCGGGGLSLGLRAAGFPAIFGVDSLEACIETCRVNKCCDGSMRQSIRASDAPAWASAARAAGLLGENRVGEIVLVGGPPCQPYANMGTRSGMSDDRDGLAAFVAIALELRPIAVVIENVPQIMTAEYDAHVQPRFNELRRAGYALYARLFHCADYAVPQRRSRAIVLALRKDSFESDLLEAHKKPLQMDGEVVVPEPVCADAIDDAEFWCGKGLPLESVVALSTIHRRATQGYFTSTTGLVSATRTAPTIISSSTTDNSYMRLLALPANVAADDMTYGHARAFGVEDILRIQSFPPGFKVMGAYTTKAQIVANAVPPRFAFALGRHLLNTILSRSTTGPFMVAATQATEAVDMVKCVRRLKLALCKLLDP